MYGFFSMTTGLQRCEASALSRVCCERCGFAEIEYRERRFGLIRSQVWRKQT